MFAEKFKKDKIYFPNRHFMVILVEYGATGN
jgi:hypothetical protein